MSLTRLQDTVGPHGLFVMGTLAEDEGRATRVLIGAAPEMWSVFQASKEAQDGLDDPLDRWSKRIIGAIASDLGASRLAFPSDGPPYPAFIAWGLASGRFWTSPVGMLVHDVAGLWISLRGAFVLPAPYETGMSGPGECPCTGCDAPCRTACPVNALGHGDYEIDACKAYLIEPAGRDCMEGGCKARRACPVSRAFGRLPAQSAFHMEAFLCR